MHKIICSPGMAVKLAAILEHEGFPTVWFVNERTCHVVTMANRGAIKACLATVQSNPFN